MAELTNDNVKPNLGLSEEAHAGVVQTLQTVLADEFILYTKLRNYHWNVVGPHFYALHEKFEQQYTRIADIIDDVAERIRTYGAKAIGTTSELSQASRLSEQPGEYPSAHQMILNLVADHEAMVRNLREDVDTVDDFDDEGAEDMLIGLLQEHQEMAWMLRVFVEEE